ncbi:O-antigen ligase [Polynucleobacter sp. MWH-Aus1W21]|uniref:O-antigen ligase family protein n=1 Tax=Polynucleobacter sp. MWH-Aus1W21 TaxID=1855880 RepID=UPI001BFE3DBC|nr:O-antigen ligase family protein [Polynucleobacter sp. MWH-Aus1W21]QWD66584.1 O-antigen ligase family protein [Polynucleobacter sp. MWH-Aus1W21]
MNKLSQFFIRPAWGGGLEKLLSLTGLLIIFSANAVLLLSMAVGIREDGITLPVLIFSLMFLLGLKSPLSGLFVYIFALPLLPGLPYQISQFFGIGILPVDALGFELTLGFILSLSLRFAWQKYVVKSHDFVSSALPWQLSLVLILITSSCCLAIARNLWQSATVTSAYGIFFNLTHFRTLGWHEDFRPLFDWLAYGMAGSIAAFLIPLLRERDDRNTLIFRPILAALLLSSLWACLQSSSGIGGGVGFRSDFFGIPAFGFQPDLHAFAGYILLGVVGLFGYLKCAKSTIEKRIIHCVIGLSFFALILSKSRSMLMIGVLVLLILIFVNLWFRNRKHFCWAASILGVLIAGIGFAWYELAMYYKTDLNGFLKSPWGQLSKSSWLIQLALELGDRELSHFNELSIALGGRPEFYRAALRMLYFFPVLGVGLGGFYRESIFEQLTSSPTLRALGGENVHNYFLQTLAETGLVGGLIFFVAIIYPMFLAIRQKQAWPALFALFGLFLGNLYAHSFLVRENFLLATVFLSLLYSTISFKTQSKFGLLIANFFRSNWKYAAVGVFFIFASREFMLSLNRYPFKYGELCFVQKDISEDGWSSGFYQRVIPQNSSKLLVEFDPLRANISNAPVNLQIQIIQDGVGVLARKNIQLDRNDVQQINVSFMPLDSPKAGPINANIRVSSCFTPKNLGASLDSRRLGLLISQIKVF